MYPRLAIANIRPILRLPIPIIPVIRCTADTKTPTAFTNNHSILRLTPSLPPGITIHLRLLDIYTT